MAGEGSVGADSTTILHWNAFLTVFVLKVHPLPRLLIFLHLPLRITEITHLKFNVKSALYSNLRLTFRRRKRKSIYQLQHLKETRNLMP
jgi:hypothetical protein